MNRNQFALILIMGIALIVSGCSDQESPVSPTTTTDKASHPTRGSAYTHAPTFKVDGVDYYMAPGAPDGPDGATDIPGHFWIVSGPDRLEGKHFNTGPFGAPNWWSSDAGDGEFLYKVKAIIDTWSEEKAESYATRGFIHYHEIVTVSDGTLHPTKVVWLKHIAVRHFNLDGGPHPEFGHKVSPGVDWEFIPNGMMPYDP